MAAAFEQAVLGGLALLRELARGPAPAAEVRRRLAAFRHEHPEVEAELVSDATGPASVAHDLLLRDEPHGTLALSLARDDGSPWGLQHAEHWAAQRVLTLDGRPLRMHEALGLWQALAARGPGAMDELLDEALLAPRLEEDDGALDDAEVQRAADGLRRRLGLRARARTLEWLGRHGLTPAGFEELARRELRRERFLERLFAAEGPGFFEARRADFARLNVVVVHGLPAEVAALAPAALGRDSLLAAYEERLRAGAGSLRVSAGCWLARELPAALRGLPAPGWVGPWRDGDESALAQVLSIEAARLDPETRRAVRSALLERWLAHARTAADVRWHWL